MGEGELINININHLYTPYIMMQIICMDGQ